MTGAAIIDTMREVRKAKGISIRALAARSGYPVCGISEWERHCRAMSLRAACDLAEALGLEIIIRQKETAE